MSDTLAYLYQLQNINYDKLSSLKFKIAVVDDDSTGLNSSQINSLESAGKTVFTYLSIGEAEDYRSYWQSSWNSNPPSFILDQNPDWGSYHVKFWDPAWQNIIISRAVEMAKEGYGGVVLDVVDVYGVSSVRNAYNGPGTARDAMMTFVGKIADATRAVNPKFKIIQNNALDLLVVNPDDPSSATNTAYLNKINGVNAETTFYMPNNAPTTWGPWNIKYLEHATKAGKVVFAMDYPSDEATQQKFINEAIAKGFVPFVSNQALSTIDSTNYQVLDKLPANALNSVLSNDSSAPAPTPQQPPAEKPPAENPPPAEEPASGKVISGTGGSDTLKGTTGSDKIYGKSGSDAMYGNDGNDYLQGDGGYDKIWGDGGDDTISSGSGNDTVYGGTGNDTIDGGTGTDRLEGESGNDILKGGDGSDTLIGGTGNDQLYGGSGNDKFAFYKGAGNDVIHDFANPGSTTGDKILVSSEIYSTKAQILSHIEYSQGNAILHLDDTNSVTVLAVAAGSMTAHDFQIV